MIAVSTAYLFLQSLCARCARTESYQQERARKLCLANLTIQFNLLTYYAHFLPKLFHKPRGTWIHVHFIIGNRDCAVVRPLASHQCVPGWIPGPGVICGLSLLLVLVPAPRVFLRVLRFSSLHKNQHFLILIRSGNSGWRATSWKSHCKIPVVTSISIH